MFSRSKKEFLERPSQPVNVLALCAGLGLLIGLVVGWLTGHTSAGIALGAGGGALLGWGIETILQKRRRPPQG